MTTAEHTTRGTAGRTNAPEKIEIFDSPKINFANVTAAIRVELKRNDYII